MRQLGLLLFLGLSTFLNAQNVTLSGFIKDAETGETLLFANCLDTISGKGVTSNNYGFYNLTLGKGQVCLSVSFLGYESKTQSFFISKDTTVTILLKPKLNELKEVVVNAFTPIKEQVLMGKTMVPVHTIKALPSFVGEPDLMKSISYLPGISTGKEGYSNIYVRGGGRGQNLILLDGIKLYNTNHVGGFLSLFNSDVIKHVDVYKGGFPARYGGRASSVIDIYTKDGNSNELKGKFNIGLLNSGIMIESPINNKMSCFLAVRSSYYDLYTIPARREYNQTGIGEYFGYTFFDINAKVNWRVSQKSTLALSFFAGHDLQKSVESLDYSAKKKNSVDKLNIHNTGISLSQTYILGQKAFLKNSIALSNYNNKIESKTDSYNYGSSITESTSSFSDIDDITFQSRIEIFPNNNNLVKTGIEISGYNFTPGIQTSYYENVNAQSIIDTTIGYTTSLRSYEGSVYFEDEISIKKFIKINLGLRGTSYVCKDTTFYRIEPRVSFRWLFSDKFSFSTNYTILNQYNHVLVNNYRGFEKEIWIAATKELIPQKAKQTSVGFFYGDDKRSLDISVEGFYKTMSNLLEYRSPVEETDNLNNIENIVAKNGKGESYGIEFRLKKDFHNLSTSFNYTLAWNYRQFKELNNGNRFPFIYDRRHDFSFVSIWKISKQYSFSGNFVLSSGTPCTLPVGYSKTDDYFEHYSIFSEINNRRLPLYHRLDVALVKKGETKKGNTKQFSINIFNVYARKNPVYIYYNNNTGKVYQKSLFSIVPTISYSVNF